ncbi:hypothetical protein DM02DRAFT_653818 [Periconia macrospinosa]|uniref:Uncharacterized protein n=1 Tax=Periconia macrospinosa TaxID=97972 RepID=A0A2V1DVI9_9PLEO|nr:hypothetical protein DM02DRAFT_653818 [Periconia macrospinosa]
MAPKGGRGGGGSSSGGSSGGSGGSSSSGSSGSSGVCEGAFVGPTGVTIINFVAYCLFFVLMLVLLISLCCVRKRHRSASTKQLIGIVYMLSLCSTLFAWALMIIFAIVRECGSGDYNSAMGLSITCSIFFNLGTFLLLFLAVWKVNSMLRQRLGHTGKFTLHKIISLVIVIVMAVLTAAYIAMNSYQTWSNYSPSSRTFRNDFDIHLYKYWQAYTGLWVVSVVFGLMLNLHMIHSLKSKVHSSLSDLTFWSCILTFFLVLYPIIDVIPLSAGLRGHFIPRDTQYALYYLSNFFQIFAWASMLFLAKSRSWEIAAGDGYYGGNANGVQQPMAQQYTYGNGPSQSTVGAGTAQGYNYQQQPEYLQHNGMPAAPTQGYVR